MLLIFLLSFGLSFGIFVMLIVSDISIKFSLILFVSLFLLLSYSFYYYYKPYKIIIPYKNPEIVLLDNLIIIDHNYYFKLEQHIDTIEIKKDDELSIRRNLGHFTINVTLTIPDYFTVKTLTKIGGK